MSHTENVDALNYSKCVKNYIRTREIVDSKDGLVQKLRSQLKILENQIKKHTSKEVAEDLLSESYEIDDGNARYNYQILEKNGHDSVVICDILSAVKSGNISFSHDQAELCFFKLLIAFERTLYNVLNHVIKHKRSNDSQHTLRPVSGFTLVELSIVLVVIGLIVGGILGGKALIKNAQTQKVTTDIAKIKTSVNIFEMTYDALPGDMADANYPFGIGAGGFDCATTLVLCNGNGDGRISVADDEHLKAWRHLALAEILPTNFSGGTSATPIVFGENAMKSPIGGGYYFDSRASVFDGNTGLYLAEVDSTPTSATSGTFSPADSWNLDKRWMIFCQTLAM